MDLTTALSGTVGVYLIIAGLVGIIRYKSTLEAMKDFVHHRGIRYSVASLEVLAGLLILFLYDVWQGWEMLITLIGLLMVAEGFWHMIATEYWEMELLELVSDRFMWTLLGVVSIGVGIAILYLGVV